MLNGATVGPDARPTTSTQPAKTFTLEHGKYARRSGMGRSPTRGRAFGSNVGPTFCSAFSSGGRVSLAERAPSDSNSSDAWKKGEDGPYDWWAVYHLRVDARWFGFYVGLGTGLFAGLVMLIASA